MNNRIWSFLGLGVFIAMAVGSQVEARTNFSLNLAGFFNAPARTVVMAPPAPVYVAAPYYEQVVVYPNRHHDYTYVRQYSYYRPAPVAYYAPAPYYAAPRCGQQVGVSVSRQCGGY